MASGRPGRWLVVMAKEPRAGAVKTRLARHIGTARAMSFARTGFTTLMRRLHRPRRWNTVVAITPDAATGSPVWETYARMPQGSGDLGARMERIFAVMPPGPVVIVGTDIPGIAPCHVARAFAALGSHDAVFGPAVDGGYWLVGLRRIPRPLQIFNGVRWSGPHALEDTLSNLDHASVAMIDMLEDVDDGESHRRLSNTGGRIVLPAKP